MIWMRFTLQIFPVALAGMICTVLGMILFPWAVLADLIIPLAVAAVLLFISLLTFRKTTGWNVVLLLGFALLIGALLRAMGPEYPEPGWPLAVVAFGLVLGSAASVGWFLRHRIQKVRVFIWILAWVYLFGWIVVAFLQLSTGVQTLWAGAGLMIFGVLSATWFAGMEKNFESEPGSALAIDLYILSLNLLVASRLIVVGLQALWQTK